MEEIKQKIIQSIGVVFFSLLYYVYEGYREAYLYFYKNTSKSLHKELHPAFTMSRVMFWIVIWILSKSLLLTFGLILMFPLIHDGTYYITRNDLDDSIYKERWKENSMTSTAIIELKYPIRLFLFYAGIAVYITYIIKFFAW